MYSAHHCKYVNQSYLHPKRASAIIGLRFVTLQAPLLQVRSRCIVGHVCRSWEVLFQNCWCGARARARSRTQAPPISWMRACFWQYDWAGIYLVYGSVGLSLSLFDLFPPRPDVAVYRSIFHLSHTNRCGSLSFITASSVDGDNVGILLRSGADSLNI